MPKCLPQHPILEHPQPTSLPQCERPSFTPIEHISSVYQLCWKELYKSREIPIHWIYTRLYGALEWDAVVLSSYSHSHKPVFTPSHMCLLPDRISRHSHKRLLQFAALTWRLGLSGLPCKSTIQAHNTAINSSYIQFSKHVKCSSKTVRVLSTKSWGRVEFR